MNIEFEELLELAGVPIVKTEAEYDIDEDLAAAYLVLYHDLDIGTFGQNTTFRDFAHKARLERSAEGLLRTAAGETPEEYLVRYAEWLASTMTGGIASIQLYGIVKHEEGSNCPPYWDDRTFHAFDGLIGQGN